MFAAFLFLWPKKTGQKLNNRIRKNQFLLLFFGFYITFLVQHWMGVEGMPRRLSPNTPTCPGT